MAKHKPKPQGVADRARHDRAFLKRALRDPGLRSKLDPSQLPAAMRQQREMNTRLNAPITPGSSMTERDLANAAGAATTVRYGPQEDQLGQQLGVAQQTQRDTGSFYDQYLADLRQHSSNVAAYQAGAQAALGQTAAGITGLSGAQGAELQAQANQAAAQQGVTPAENLAPMLSDAAAIRQSLIGSFQAQQALQGANANTYADTQAHDVGPGQKLAAQAQAAGRTRDVRKQVENLKSEEGAFNQQFRDTRRQDEFKNVLAQQTLSANVANDQAQNNIASTKAVTDAAAKSPAGKGAATAATEEAKNAAKYGYNVHQWRLLGPNGRAKVIAKSATKGKGADVITSGAFAGYTKDQVAKLDPGRKQQLIDSYNAAVHPGKGKGNGKGKDKTGKGPDWQTNAQQGQGASDAANLKDLANRAKTGQPFVPGHTKQKPLSRPQAVQKIQQSAKIRDPVLLSAALDAAYDGHLSRETVRKLIAAGYKPSRIASALGVPTPGNYTPPSTPNRSAGSVVPGIGPTVANR
jgi:hypothetical protein